MNTASHFRFLLDSVEYNARRTESVLYHDCRHFWDDILESWDHREEKRGYWLFCTRWIREQLLGVMRRGSPRALLGILSALHPDLAPPPSAHHTPSPALKRRIVAILLPIMMREALVRVRNASVDRLGPSCSENASYHPEDHSS